MIGFIVLCLSFGSRASNSTSKYDTIIDNATMPRGDDAMAVAYDSNTNAIVLLGGVSNGKQYFTFMLDTKEFVDVNETYLPAIIYDPAQFSIQIQDTLWLTHETGTSLMKFNLQTLELQSTKESHDYWTNPCLTSHEHYLFVVGGRETYSTVYTFQVYDIQLDEWLDNVPSSLPTIADENEFERERSACIVVDGTLYIIGGFRMLMGEVVPLDTVATWYVGDVNSINKDEYQLMDQRLSTGLYMTRAIQYGSDILVIGGNDGSHPVSDIHVINTETKTVTVGGQLSMAAESVAPIIVNDVLYIFGGYNLDKEYPYILDIYQYIELSLFINTSSISHVNTTSNDSEQRNDTKTSTNPIFIVLGVIGGIILCFVVACIVSKICYERKQEQMHAEYQELLNEELLKVSDTAMIYDDKL